MSLRIYLLTILSLITCSSLYAFPCLDTNRINQIKAIAERVGKELVPDKRTDVFEFSVTDTEIPVLELETTISEAAARLNDAFVKAALKVSVLPSMLPAKSLGDKTNAIVNLSVSNNRKEPRNAAELVTQLLLGTPVHILKKQRGYALVRSPDGYISWLDNDALYEMGTEEFNNWQKAPKLMFVEDVGFSYAAPDVTALRVSDLVKGDIVKVTGKEKKFYRIVYPDNRIAYIPLNQAEDLKKWMARPNPAPDQILQTAKTFIGIPYLWGGTSVKGLDCSGFTKSSFFLNGIVLPRDASQQALIGEPVDIYEADTVNITKCLRNLQPGDLLFFSSEKSRSDHPRITHTAIYMQDGTFIQAAGMVRINSMLPDAANYADFQTRKLVSARRMLTSIGKPQITRLDHHPAYSIGNATY